MITLDASERNKCVVKRQVTNTPLQALILMNDPQYVEASQSLAYKMMKNGGESLIDQIKYGFKLATSRSPNNLELERLTTIYHKQYNFYSNHNKEAIKLLGTNTNGLETISSYSDVAAFVMVANTIINLDETVRKG